MNDGSLQSLIDQLQRRTTPPALAPNTIWDETLDERIMGVSIQGLAYDTAAIPYAQAVLSGLHLWNESLDRSHSLSQEVHNNTGSYWHGLMHRMEADYSNAKYWFRRAGSFPVHKELYEYCVLLSSELKRKQQHNTAVEQLVSAGTWDPDLFVDLVEATLRKQDAESALLLTRIQQEEIAALLKHTYQRCSGGQ